MEHAERLGAPRFFSDDADQIAWNFYLMGGDA